MTSLPTESLRKLIELSVITGRKLLNSQTGFLHFHPNKEENELSPCIPILENAYFALALMRTKLSENISDGKNLLGRLLEFQNLQTNEFFGNFPLYLHEYPLCRDYFNGIHLLVPFYWIFYHFHHVLGSELKTKLEATIHRLLEYAYKIQSQKNLPLNLLIKVGALMVAFGELWKITEMKSKGEPMIHALPAKLPDLFFNPHELSDLLIAFQLMDFKTTNSLHQSFFSYLKTVWHFPSCTFMGPCLKNYQQDLEPQPTLLDLYFGLFRNSFPARALITPQVMHLQGALIQQVQDVSLDLDYPIQAQGTFNGQKWLVEQTSRYAYSLFQKKQESNQSQDRFYHPLYMVWGDLQRVHTLVCQGSQQSHLTFEVHQSQFDMTFQFKNLFKCEDWEKDREMAFYFDLADEYSITINEKSATTFEMDDEIKIVTPHLSFSIKFNLIEGEGSFKGHLMKGNRSSQISNKGEKRYNAYDWQVFLRTLRRSENCIVRARITIVDKRL
jgi:hypothetical protein